MSSEFERIARLQSLFGPPPSGVRVGIGDDAAVIESRACLPDTHDLVWTVDSCVENVHFRRDIASWVDVGWRSFMAAASDLAAMAARPLGALSALQVVRELTDEELDQIAQGQHQAACAIGTRVIGGNMSRGGEVAVTTTLLGITRRAPPRDGARPNDVVVMAGDVGMAGAGLALLLRGAWSSTCPHQQAAVRAWRRPVALIEAGTRCENALHSLIDVSDGLAQDAAHIAQASRVGIEIEPDAVVSPSLRVVAECLERDPLELSLGSGEDYALLGTCDESQVPRGFRVIGRCSSGEGVRLRGGVNIHTLGHDHFRSCP